MVEKQTFKVSAINSLGSKVNKLQQSVHLDRTFCLIGVFCFFFSGSYGYCLQITKLSKTEIFR